MQKFYTLHNLFVISFSLLLSFVTIKAQGENCFVCHNDNELSFERNGKLVSLFVDENKYKSSVHGSLECEDCHTGFDPENIPHREGKEIYKVNCADCHEEYSQLVSNDIHHRLKDKVGNKTPECVTCHGSHEIKNPSLVTNKVQEYCSQCHDNIVLAKSISPNVCFQCHDTNVHEPEMKFSVHSELVCNDCHNYIANNLDKHPENVPNTQVADCYLCHSQVAAQHRESIHGISLSEGIEEAAQCWDCHGSDNIMKVDDPNSPVYPTNVASTCGKCHDNAEFSDKFDLGIICPSRLYSQSVHGKLVSEGNFKAATCVVCHGVHNIKNRVQPDSRISTFNIPYTCGECHKVISEEYEQSIHWIRAKKGVRESPVCTGCHCEHGVEQINQINKRDEIRKIQEQTCIRCHEGNFYSEKFGKNGGQAREYQDSYHGLAVMRGDLEAAMCIDCHGVHKILPKNHPESTVNEKNVTSTCRKCHEDATTVFANSYSHKTMSEEARRIESIVQNIYFWLIIAVIGSMILHNLLIFISETRKKRKREKNLVSIPRFTQNEIIQHILLLLSFITLAITGFALKFPESWWAEGLTSLGMSETIRQNTHRVAAVLIMVVGVYHIIYLFATNRGRDVLKNLIPKFKDIQQVGENLSYYLGINKSHPEFDNYDYTEKAEYWALIWGTLIMGLTGLILWFPTFVGDWAPVWLIKVCETIHFYEAILATLAILVWHWFFVIVHPREYPMSFTWIDGNITLEKYRYHHESHFKKVLLDWKLMKEGKTEFKKLSYSTKFFIDSLNKKGLNADDVFQSEINRDLKLKTWLEDQISD